MAPPTAFVERFRESITPNAVRSYFAEFNSTFIYVFMVVGSAMSARKMMPDGSSTDPSTVVAVALANVFGLTAAVFMSANISGGHVNPAVTFGMAVGGHVSVPTALFYWTSQMLAATMASYLLKLTTIQPGVPSPFIEEEMTGFGASIVEGVLTFILVYVVYGSGEMRHGGSLGAVVVGFTAGAGVLAAAPFSGGSMNPACAFGSAVVAGSFKNQAVYWVGPLIGAATATLVYDYLVFPSQVVVVDQPWGGSGMV